MKQILPLVLIATASLGTTNIAAQDAKLFFCDEPIGETTIGGYFNKVSSNGEYAVGYDEFLSSATYIWQRSTGQITILNDGLETTEAVYDVADDATIAGTFFNKEKSITVTMPNGTERTINGVYESGYMKDGVVTWLPLPANADLSYSDDLAYSPKAVAISSDGKIIGGYTHYNNGMYYPIMWREGVLEEFTHLQLEGQGFGMHDMSDDGNIITGWTESEKGDRLPAIIENGVLKKLYEVPEDGGYFIEGIATRVDADNNVVGYLQDEDYHTHGFIYNTANGMTYITGDGALASASRNADIVFGVTGIAGAATVIANGKTTDMKEYLNLSTDKYLSSVMDCSRDGKVIVGAGIVSSTMGMYNVPFAIELSEDIAAGIDAATGSQAEANNVSIDSHGTMFVSGTYDKVEVYSTAGACVMKSKTQGGVLDASSLAGGVYAVKVLNGKAVSTFKVIKK